MPGKQWMRIASCVGAILILLLCPPAYSQQKRRGNDPFRKFVTALPPVDKVEVQSVSTFLADDMKNVDCTRADIVCHPDRFPLKIDEVKTLTGADADHLSSLWRKLERDYLHPEDVCFSPDRILRFYQGDVLLLETEVSSYGRKITLPNRGVISVAGGLDAPYYLFQEFLRPDSSLKQNYESFKREMLPKVGQQLTVMGLLGGAKSAAVVFGKWEIYIYGIPISEENYLYNLGCNIAVKVIGTLRLFEPPHQEGPFYKQTPPEHFYFDKPEIKVISVEPRPRSKRSKRKR